MLADSKRILDAEFHEVSAEERVRVEVPPPEPYRPDARAPWRRGQAPIVELPIGVTPLLRTPAIGTSLLLAPAWLRARLLRAMRRRPFFNLELHGIDLADADRDGHEDVDVGLGFLHGLEFLDTIGPDANLGICPADQLADRQELEHPFLDLLQAGFKAQQVDRSLGPYDIETRLRESHLLHVLL